MFFFDKMTGICAKMLHLQSHFSIMPVFSMNVCTNRMLLQCFCLFFLISACQNAAPTLPKATIQYKSTGKIERLHPDLDRLIAPDAVIEVLADGFIWAEGPLWIPEGDYLLFTDIPNNRIVRWKEGEGATTWLTPSGYTGSVPRGGEPGANGLLRDATGRLVMCQHGDRRMAKMEADLDKPKPVFTTLVDRWNGKRLNSPNDAVYDRQGNLYFTDPPYGLEKNVDDPAKEIPFQGVYCLRPDGSVDLLTDSITRPNGIAFSPDEKTVYVACSDPEKAIWMAYDHTASGALTNGRIFYNATAEAGKMQGLPDGLKVNGEGILFATGPGGIWIFRPDGTVLGRIDTGVPTANCAFGNDGKALYITADDYLMRVWLK